MRHDAIAVIDFALAVVLVPSLPCCTAVQRPAETPAPAPASPPVARIVSSGAIDCFAKGLKAEDGSPATCEISAAAIRGDSLVLASDKPIPLPNSSPVFRVAFAGTLPREVRPDRLTYITARPFVSAAKYEDMTVTPDGEYLFATTGFDRFDPASSRFDVYDTLLFWPAGQKRSVS
jgi:hypothetical protein